MEFYVSPFFETVCSNGINGVYYTGLWFEIYASGYKKNQTTTINNATNINKYGYGTMSSVGFTQPGLLKGQNVVIQGIDYSEDLKWMFLCGYVDPKENLTTGNTNSVVFILYMTQNDPVTGNPGKFIKEVILQTTTGGAYTGPAGGIAVT